MDFRRVAIIAFYDEKKRILLQNRHDISKRGEEWGFFGGGIEAGETPLQAIIREIKEELEYDLIAPRFVDSFRETLREREREIHIFAAPLPPLSKFTQREGNGMRLVTIAEAKLLKVVSFDLITLAILEKVL